MGAALVVLASAACAPPGEGGFAQFTGVGSSSSSVREPGVAEGEPGVDAGVAESVPPVEENDAPAPPAPEAPSPAAPPAGAPPDLVAAARIGLPLLPVKGRAPKTGYDRALFGQAWSDDVTVAGGHNGCDTRNDTLARDLQDIVFRPGTHYCVVLSGTLLDPYSGETIPFTRGKGTSQAVQIDHIVALSDAWQKGAQQISEEQRRNLANDPLNLQAVKGVVNQQKSDGDAATWLPPNTEYRCEYAARQVVVKQEYGLWVTPAEHDALDRQLATCAPPPGE